MHFQHAKSLNDACVRLKVLYMKHHNNTEPNLIMRYLSHAIPCSPLHAHTHTHMLYTHCNLLWISIHQILNISTHTCKQWDL